MTDRTVHRVVRDALDVLGNLVAYRYNKRSKGDVDGHIRGLADTAWMAARGAGYSADGGYGEMTKTQVRVVLETFVNLSYIVCVGPQVTRKTTAELAKQFWAWGSVEEAKRIASLKKYSMKYEPQEVQKWDEQLSAVNPLAQAAKALGNDARRSRWHDNNFAQMAGVVASTPMPFSDSRVLDLAIATTSVLNSAAHGGVMSITARSTSHEKAYVDASLGAHLAIEAFGALSYYFDDWEWMHGERTRILGGLGMIAHYSSLDIA